MRVLLFLCILFAFGAAGGFVMAEIQSAYYIWTPIMDQVRPTIYLYSWFPFFKGFGVCLFSMSFIFIIGQILRMIRIKKSKVGDDKIKPIRGHS
jgi:hypothetical protein